MELIGFALGSLRLAQAEVVVGRSVMGDTGKVAKARSENQAKQKGRRAEQTERSGLYVTGACMQA